MLAEGGGEIGGVAVASEPGGLVDGDALLDHRVARAFEPPGSQVIGGAHAEHPPEMRVEGAAADAGFARELRDLPGFAQIRIDCVAHGKEPSLPVIEDHADLGTIASE